MPRACSSGYALGEEPILVGMATPVLANVLGSTEPNPLVRVDVHILGVKASIHSRNSIGAARDSSATHVYRIRYTQTVCERQVLREARLARFADT